MRMTRWLLAALVLVDLGCATGPAGAPGDPPVDVSGLWRGTITLGATSKLRCCGGSSGPVHLNLEQDGARVIGSVTGIGFYGTVTGHMRGTDLVGDFRYSTGQTGGGSHFSAAVSGNEMLAETVESKLIFSRAR